MEDTADRIIKVDIENEMKSAYIDYSMSVIVSRALPDVRDGLKPVHRRVLYSMNETGNTHSSATRKCAKAVGDILGKYHPHGDSSVYNALVRLVQPWNQRYPMVEGQGNFGSVDGDSPAAMRYTESRLSIIAQEMLRDIDKETVDFQDNFDGTTVEPLVLPARIPNLLINGASGIAVGMATNMAPHNLSESIDGCIAYIDAQGEITSEELMEYVKAPDFPTGGYIYGYAGVKEAYTTGRGRVVMRAKAEIETTNNKERIIVTEIPYLVNKSELVAHIARLVNDKTIDGITDLTDESNKNGIRIVMEIRRDANASVVLNHLYTQTALQSYFSINNIALVHGRPQLLTLKDTIKEFVDHRHDVVTRRAQYELRKAEERKHLLEGFMIAFDHLDEIIRMIRSSESTQDAISNLMKAYQLSDLQARAIVEMRLRQLTKLDIQKIADEYKEVQEKIQYLESFLADRSIRMSVIRDELLEIKDKYKDPRRSEIIYAAGDFDAEDFYADDEMVITISHLGYIKRTPLADFRTQSRGGVGSKGADSRDEDFVEYIYSASMHATIMLFTAKGKCYWIRVFEIPEGNKNSKGRAVQNLLNIESDDKITAFIRVKKLTKDVDFINSHYLLFATQKGMIKKTILEAYSRPRANGVQAIKLNEGDQVVSVKLTNGTCHILMANRNGRAIHFPEDKVRPMGRTAAGVRGMLLDNNEDAIVGMVSVKQEDVENATVMVVSEKGFGKRSSLEDYRITNRGGKGVKTMNITDKTGHLVDIRSVEENSDIMIINKSGVAIRLSVDKISVIGRATQGVKLIDLNKRSDEIASVCSVIAQDEEEQEDLDNDNLDSENGSVENYDEQNQ